MNEISGSPLRGGELERLQGFLARHGLSWDEGIEHSVMLIDAGQVVACGSCRANVIECLAVSEERRGEGLLGQVFTHLVGWLVAHGRTQWFCFTKPALRLLVESLGMRCLVATDKVAMLESRKHGLDDYLERVRKETREQLGEKGGCAGERGVDGPGGRADEKGADAANEFGCADRPGGLAGVASAGEKGASSAGGPGKSADAMGSGAWCAQGAAGTDENIASTAGTGKLQGVIRPVELANMANASATIGAIVANCNPLTLGHMYLIETAAAEVDVLHVFVLAAEQDFMPARDRLALVREACAELPNVAVHSGGDYLLSPATFPTYFHKDQATGLKANCRLDVELFAQRVAPALGITRRFVGTEPTCAVTRQYNECMQEFLPKAGIEVVEVPRLEAQDDPDGMEPASKTPFATQDGARSCEPISASTVRALTAQGNWQAIARLVPACTLEYLARRYGWECASDCDDIAGDSSAAAVASNCSKNKTR